MGTTKKGSRYQPQKTIAEHAYAKLSLGMDLKTQHPVLIRAFKPGILSSEAEWKGFRQQLEDLRQTQVPGVLPAAGIGGGVSSPFLVITGTTGRSLRDELSDPNPSPVAALVGKLQAIAIALDHLHNMGFIHGDVRPDTLFFNNEQTLLLNEFASHYALCGWTQQSQDMHPQLVNAVFPKLYLAPELQDGGKLTPQSDQYSLALVLLELCSGIRLRENLNLNHVIEGQLVSGNRQPALAKLKPILERALSQEPTNRFATCQEMISAATQALNQSQPMRWVIAGIGSALGLVILILLAQALGGGSDPGNLDNEEAWKEAARNKIARPYQRPIAPVPNAEKVPQLPANESTATDPFLKSAREQLLNQ